MLRYDSHNVQVMLRNYLTTSLRNLARNKIFSLINIAGLAISMSVGLLLIAFVIDLFSYDRFHVKGKRIYRVASTVDSHLEKATRYISTSVRAARLIRESMRGIEEVSILRADFAADVRIDDDIFPVKGYWADSPVFDIFTFPLLEGNPQTALKEPYTLVLTETTAKRLFGQRSALGQIVKVDTIDYKVTGVIQDVPFFSHIQFEALASFSTIEHLKMNDPHFNAWTNVSLNYVYLLLPEDADMASIEEQLAVIAQKENLRELDARLYLGLVPLYESVAGETFQVAEGGPGSVGPHISPRIIWILVGLSFVVVLSACFNYTNLSMARAMRRFKEVGIRKAIGAGARQVRQQFLAEAIIVSLAALLLSHVLFLFLRPRLIELAPEMQNMVRLELKPLTGLAFVGFSVVVGVLAGFTPSLFFAKINPISALKNVATVRVFKYVTLRRVLLFIQFTVTLIFITTTAIGYVQYKAMLAFDLGFNTENILNIDMQNNPPDEMVRRLNTMPEVVAVSRSGIVTSVGNARGGFMRYRDSGDSLLVWTNRVDENYLPLHEHVLVSGRNFQTRPTSFEAATEIIVNEQLLKRLGIAEDSEKAIGEEVVFSSFGKAALKMTIVGVIRDFHYGKLDNLIPPVAFMFWLPGDRAVVNVKVKSLDPKATLAKIESLWKEVDPVHTFEAEFFDESIEDAYSEYSSQIKIIGLLSTLAISIACMGLFGMVLYATEARLREICIRKVMGATALGLIFLLSRGFLTLLVVAALIALPVTYLAFENVLLIRFPYHEPVGMLELFIGFMFVMLLACLMIGAQTIKAAGTNPADVLRSEG